MLPRFLVALLVLAAGVPALGGRAEQSPAPSLLTDAPSTPSVGLRTAVARPEVVRSRATTVNMTALDGELVDVAVASDRTLRARLVGRIRHPDGSESWAGQVEGEPLSAVTFVRSGNILQGSVRTLSAAYSIEPLGADGLHTVSEIDLQSAGPELPARIPPAMPALADTPPMSADDGSQFDLLVVYTAAARMAAGSEAGILARINLGVTETNTAYANSGIVPRLRLVGAEEVSYTESGNLETDLNAITRTADGLMDAVHARRNAVGADLVKLVVGDAAGGACGVAWLMTSLSSGFAGYAFSVTAYPCISPNYTFGHELGHNMGSNHAPEDGSSAGLYPHSFGYKHPGNAFRTVMAYNCAAGCPRVLYFSNPAISYSGLPTGTVTQHNNALSINNARDTIANWRADVVGENAPPTISTIANQATLEDLPTPAIAFTVGDSQTPAASLTVTATSSSPLIVANTPAALTLGGSGANRTLAVSPQQNAAGTSTITVTVSDGTLTASRSFQLTVTAVNDPPGVSAVAPQTTGEDQALSVPFTVWDVESAAGNLTVQATSSNSALSASRRRPRPAEHGRRVRPVPSWTAAGRARRWRRRSRRARSSG